MAEVATTAKAKRSIQDVTNDGADGAASAPKKPCAAAPAEAPTTELTKLVKNAAQTFQTVANKHAPGWNPQKGEDAAALVERVARGIAHYTNIARPVAEALDKNYDKKWKTTKLRNAIKRALENVPAAAFVAAGAPPKKKEEEGYVEGTVDIRKDGDDEWHRYKNQQKLSEDTAFVGEKVYPADVTKMPAQPSYAKQRGFELRRVTDATRHATSTNKVVRGWHAPLIAHTDRNYGCDRSLAAEAKKKEEERAEKAADAAADKETREVDYVIRCAEFGLAVVAAPPLPDGATDADRERLEDEALAKLYGH